MAELTDTERAILDFERGWFKYAGAKEQQIRERFDLGATRYFQVLNGLLERREAAEYAPMLVKRLRGLRDARQVQRRAG